MAANHGNRPLLGAGCRAGRAASLDSDDEALVRGILGGSRFHFEVLYERFFQRVYGFALRRLGDPGQAEDATRAVFETLLGELAHARPAPSLLEWIFGIARDCVTRRSTWMESGWAAGARPRESLVTERGIV